MLVVARLICWKYAAKSQGSVSCGFAQEVSERKKNGTT
jgi:hypothetical protein